MVSKTCGVWTQSAVRCANTKCHKLTAQLATVETPSPLPSRGRTHLRCGHSCATLDRTGRIQADPKMHPLFDTSATGAPSSGAADIAGANMLHLPSLSLYVPTCNSTPTDACSWCGAAGEKLADTSITSVASECRICKCGPEEGRLVRACRCRGTSAFVHAACLQRWLQCRPGGAGGRQFSIAMSSNAAGREASEASNSQWQCEVCKAPYTVKIQHRSHFDPQRCCSARSCESYFECGSLLVTLSMLIATPWLVWEASSLQVCVSFVVSLLVSLPVCLPASLHASLSWFSIVVRRPCRTTTPLRFYISTSEVMEC